MQRKNLNIYLYLEHNKLKLRMIEVHCIDDLPRAERDAELAEYDDEDSDSDSDFDGPHPNNLGLYMLSGLVSFNEIDDWNSPEVSDILKCCWYGDNLSMVLITDNLLRYAYTDYFWMLAYSDEKTLLQQLGALDVAMHSFKSFLSEQGFDLRIHHSDTVPDFNNRIDIIRQIRFFNQRSLANPSQSLSRFVTTGMVTELNKRDNLRDENKNIIELLNQLLQTEDFSLSRVIRQKLKPVSFEIFATKSCEKHPEMVSLFNPNVHHSIATKSMLDNLSKMLPSATWFAELASLQNRWWQIMIEKIYFLPAPDKGNYTYDYTEIKLLQQADLRFNNDGSVSLQYLNTDAYQKYYATGTVFSDLLEDELRTALNFMGLKLLPNQNVYKGEVFFTPESCIYLKNCGFHMNEKRCKGLMRASHWHHFFNTVNDTNPFNGLPHDIHTSIINQNDPELTRMEIEEMRSRTFERR